MNGSVRSAAALVWRHQRIVWWVFFVNLVLAWLSSLPARVTLGTVLNHSLQSAKFVSGFDLAALVAMIERPDVAPGPLAAAATTTAVVFFIYLLFLDGGIFAVYLDDRKLSRAEFFESSGLFFWRMVRLALYSLVPFAIVGAASGAISSLADKLSSDAPQERLGFFVSLAARILFGMIFLFVRLWFDLAQARVVKDNKRHLLGTTWRSLKLAFRSGRLYASYLGIALFSVIVFCVGAALWYYLPHAASGASFIVWELVTVLMISSRLWMKAASARWLALLPAETTLTSVPLAPPPVDLPAQPVEVLEVTEVQPSQPEPPPSE